MDFQNAQWVNNQYFKYFSNGGYGHLPQISDDQLTTDQLVARRIEYPSFRVKDYYENYRDSSFYTFDQNRKKTFEKQLSSLSNVGAKIIGGEKNGEYSMYACVPDPSGHVKLYSTSQETNSMLWIIIGIGALALIAQAVAPY